MANDIDEEKLFHGFGPFATFAQRTEVAYAFNLIDKNMKNDLDYIRVIRNHFAHHPRKISFQSVKITSLCKKLTSAQPKEIIGSDKIHTETDSKSQYLLAIASFVVFAHNSMVVGKIK